MAAVVAKLLAASGGLLALSASLHGCGGGGAKPTPSPTPSPPPTPHETTTTGPPTTTSTTVTVTPKVRTPGGDPTAVAKLLNDLYYGFDPADDTTPIGITMNLPSNRTDFYGNIFCNEYDNPLGRTGCSGGRCDCRFSAALYNHLMLITEGSTLMDILARRVAIVFNQTLVEQYMARCYFVWDGATNNKYNVGCGNGARSSDCNDPESSYGNVCPSTGKVCTADAIESQQGMCQPYGGEAPPPPAHSIGFQCGFPGPALDFHGQDDWRPNETTKEDLRDMVKFRLNNQAGKDGDELKIKMWNEVVLDLRLMMPKIWEDPALVIPAIVYWKDDLEAKADAKHLRDGFCKTNQLSAKIPLLALDWKALTLNREDIFVALPEESEDVEVVI